MISRESSVLGFVTSGQKKGPTLADPFFISKFLECIIVYGATHETPNQIPFPGPVKVYCLPL